MKVFISWSEKRSLYVATALRDWLPRVLQVVKPFISTQDISKGQRGIAVITEQLQDTNFGIVCLTPENLERPWILFEAGALSKLPSAYVCTYLFKLTKGNVPPPLGQFQHTEATEEDTRVMLQTINEQLRETKLEADRLADCFEKWWPDLATALANSPAPEDNATIPEARSADSKLDELLDLVRKLPGDINVRSSNAIYRRSPTKAAQRDLDVSKMPRAFLALLGVIENNPSMELDEHVFEELASAGLLGKNPETGNFVLSKLASHLVFSDRMKKQYCRIVERELAERLEKPLTPSKRENVEEPKHE